MLASQSDISSQIVYIRRIWTKESPYLKLKDQIGGVVS